MSPGENTRDFYREQGRLEEQQRILKLLEDKNTCDGGLSSGNCTCAAIAFIKGASK